MDNQLKKSLILIVVVSIFVSSVFGGAVGFWAGSAASGNYRAMSLLKKAFPGIAPYADEIVPKSLGSIEVVNEESAVVKAVEKVSPAVVSIIVSKDLPKIEYYSPFGNDFFQEFFGSDMGDFFGFDIPRQQPQNGTQKQEIGGGTGFIITSDGFIVTNKHVVSDTEAEYTVLMNNEKKYPAKVLARDNMLDFAVLKIEEKNLPTVELGDSTAVKAGQTAIAIGNALAEFRNTVSVGVISGLSRSITAGGRGIGSEELVGVIQTDAAINSGNSGGPLSNIAGQVIGMNTAVAQGAQGIGFAIPVNDFRQIIESVRKDGRIVKPYLGVRYVQVTKEIAQANKLDVDYGALVLRGENNSDLAVIPGSPADKAGIVENDIILEINGKKIDSNNPLAKAISGMKIGQDVTLKILHRGDKKDVKVKLEEMK